MFRQREPSLDVSIEPRGVIPPGRKGRGVLPLTAHGSQSKQRGRFAKAFFQPEIGVPCGGYHLALIVAVVGQCVAELVSKLKTVLRPVSILSGESDGDSTGRSKFEIDLRMIGPVIDVETVELSPWAMPPKLRARRLQHGRDISGTNPPESIRLHPDIQRVSSEIWVMIRCSYRVACE